MSEYNNLHDQLTAEPGLLSLVECYTGKLVIDDTMIKNVLVSVNPMTSAGAIKIAKEYHITAYKLLNEIQRHQVIYRRKPTGELFIKTYVCTNHELEHFKRSECNSDIIAYDTVTSEVD